MYAFDEPRSDEPPGCRSFRTLMEESRPFRGVAVPGDEQVPGEALLRQARKAANLDTEGAYIPYQDLLFGVGMGVC